MGIQYLVVLLMGLVGISHCELFTSNAHLQTALYAEKDIASLLNSYVQQEQVRLEKIKRLAADYESHSSMALNNIESYLANPINAFLLIKRFTLDWDRDVLPVVSNNTWESLYREIDQARSDLPTYEDLKGAASALMRLQDTYLLDTSTVARGNLGGVKSPELSVDDCFELGRISYNEGDFYHTMLWMQHALNEKRKQEAEDGVDEVEVVSEIYTPIWGNRFGEEGDQEDEEESSKGGVKRSKAEMLDFLAFSHYKLGDIDQALELTNELLRIDPTHERATNNKHYFEVMLKDPKRRKPSDQSRPSYQANRDEYRNSEEFLTYEALCRDEVTQPLQDVHKLSCQYRSNNHPILLLQPVKEETVNLDPWVAVYHDVISDEEIRQIKHLATPRLNRATVQNAKTGELETANYRISKSAWLKAEDHPVVKKLNDRMQAITGLDMETAEELQIANYGLGGHYEPHFDFARKEEKDAFKSLGTGNRIATFLNYMSDVEAGGATVFPYIGLKLFPKKGNAAFWYNLYKNGDGIYNTRHAACPVLVGTKWVANKWIHERGQEFRRPCGMGEDE